jgi:hypothetical protein
VTGLVPRLNATRPGPGPHAARIHLGNCLNRGPVHAGQADGAVTVRCVSLSDAEIGCVVTGLRGQPLHTGAGGLVAAADDQVHAALLEIIDQQFTR